MSKTVSTCLCETNQAKGAPQENVFFHTLYRTQADFPDEFLRSAKSTSPIQICAIFSTMGPDDAAAMLNIELNKELSKIVASAQSQSVLDFEAFSNQVINVLNIKVCNYSVAKGGTPLKSSMTMVIIEGDTLRVIHIGNTKAVLLRDNKIMALTEEMTVAHRYVQMGAITPEQEKNHPENMNLTQYLGKLPQDGPLVPDKKVHLKLKDNDEVCLMGLGVSRKMPSQMRNVILVKPTPAEMKARELVTSAFNYGINTGLTVILIKIESTFLLPGDAVFESNLGSEEIRPSVKEQKKASDSSDSEFTSFGESAFDEDEEEYPVKDRRKSKRRREDMEDDDDESFGGTAKFNRGQFSDFRDDPSSGKEGKKVKDRNKKEKGKGKVWDFLIPIITFLVFIGVGYGILYAVFNARHLLDFMKPTESTAAETYNRVMYVINDNTPLYAESSLDADQLAILSRGDVVTMTEDE